MNRRLQQFLTVENISQSQLADTLGVARASISHILAGRNKPGFDFIERLTRHYPALSVEWLITGRGRMYAEAKPASGPEPAPSPLPPAEELPVPAAGTLFDEAEEAPQRGEKRKNITKIIVFYSDGSFAEIE